MIQYLERMKESDRTAIIYQEKNITYKQLFHWIAFNQSILQKYQFPSAECIAFHVTNQFEFVITFLSLAAWGAKILPISPDVLEQDVINLRERVHLIFLREDIKKEIVNENNCETELQSNKFENREKDTCLIHMTSGSSGRIKLCQRSMEALDFEGFSYRMTFHLSVPYEILSLCPLEHSFSFGAVFVNAVVNGCTLHIVDKFNPRQILKYLGNHKINMMTMIPDMAKVLCSVTMPDGGGGVMQDMKVCLTATAKVTEEIYTMFYEKFNVKLLSNYGSTETGGAICRTDENDYEKLGRAMWNVKLKVCDANGQEVPVGSEGLLYIKSPGMFSGYIDDKYMFDEEGYFTLNDKVKLDQEGNITFMGRNSRMAKVNGMKVSLEEVERAILDISGVKECKVIFRDNYLTAYVVADRLSKTDCYFELEKRIHKNAIPRKFVFKKRFERDQMGKIRLSNLCQDERCSNE